MNKKTEEDLIKRAEIPSKNALKMHPFYQGKIQILPKCQIHSHKDFGIWYSPGVAAVSEEIAADKNRVFKYTNKSNYVAVVSDGSRVLGLGDIGPEAALPVMEGKALLFKYLGGVDAFPLTIGTNDGCNAKEIINFIKRIQPTFGGINLEDISKPKCFSVLDALRKNPELTIPIWHDDQQGTATVTLAALINALKIVGKKKDSIKIVFNGIGAANFAIQRLLKKEGFNLSKSIFVDSKGILYKDRADLQNPEYYKYEVTQVSNPEGVRGQLDDALEGADVLISLSIPGPNVIKKNWISRMAEDAIVFACANPVPEIFPWDAKEAGAKIVATGRSDFENQVNNSLGFPGIFRGTLDVRAKTISDEMCIAAAYQLANIVEDIEGCLKKDCIIPTMDYEDIYIREAVAVGLKAIEQGIAQIALSEDEMFMKASESIKKAQNQTEILMKEGSIPLFEDYSK
jgi:malate dehydrogenase (oxaloacetate-decarboxylating)